MASIEKRTYPDGTVMYRARVTKKGAPRLSQSFTTEREAKRWSHRMESEIINGRFFGREETKERTFTDFVDRYIETELPKNPKAFGKQRMMMLWWKEKLGEYFLSHISPAMISELRDSLLKGTTYRGTLRTRSTANRYLAALGKAFSVCEKQWFWIKESPMRRVSRLRENKARERYLTKDEITRLLDACRNNKSPHLYPVVIFALGTGARKGEILNLKWSNIDFFRSTATFMDTKNGENRTVHLSDQILNALEEHRGRRIVASTYIFNSLNGQKPADITKAWVNAVKQAGLGKDVVFHTLRHSAASHLAMNGLSMLEIGAVLGHKSNITKRYCHLSPQSTAKALNRLNDDIFGVQNSA